jgi:hypothetical protein
VSKSDAGAAGEWQLSWTARGQPVPCRLVPLLSGWADLDQRENAADIGARHPILIDPKSRIDPVLARFLGRSRFAWLAAGTRQAYTKDYWLFFSFLWQRGRYWHEADPDDLLDWEAWRRRGQQPGRGIGGSKWQRELAALRLVYEWAEKEQRIERSPVLVHQVGLRGVTVTVADQAPRDVRSADVKWVTPRTYRLWRDVGLLGYDAAGQPDPLWRGRNDGRNAAFTDLLFSSGLRLREGGCLLTLEVPDAAGGHGYREGTVAGAAAADVLRLGRRAAPRCRLRGSVAGFGAWVPVRHASACGWPDLTGSGAWCVRVVVYGGAVAGGSQGWPVNSRVRASSASMPHLPAVDR